MRNAVREVEEALLQLQLNDARSEQAQRSLASMEQVFKSAQTRMRQGMLSGLELEESRRGWYAAQSFVVALQWERRRAWVALYRAAGGGWDSLGCNVVNCFRLGCDVLSADAVKISKRV